MSASRAPRARLLLAGALGVCFAGCVVRHPVPVPAPPAPPARASSREVLSERLERVAQAVAAALGEGAELELEGGLPDPRVRARLERALAAEGVAVVERCEEVVLALETTTTAGGWWVEGTLVGPGGAVLERFGLEVTRAALRGPPPEEPLAISRYLLAAVRDDDGEAVVATLDASLLRSWGLRAAEQGLRLEDYALDRLGALAAYGRPASWEVDRGSLRTEVEVRFPGKTRDVDLLYRWRRGRWGLTRVKDLD